MAASRSLYVGGLDESVSLDTLKAAFIPFGNLKDVQLPQDKDGKSRGFAFVEFDEDEDAAAAIENMDGAELCGRCVCWVARGRRLCFVEQTLSYRC